MLEIIGNILIMETTLLNRKLKKCLSISDLDKEQVYESLIKSSLTSLYALRILKAHGLRKEAIQRVTEAIIMSRILYATPTSWGLTQASNIVKIDKLHRKLQRIEYTSHDHPITSCSRPKMTVYLSHVCSIGKE